MVGVWWSTVFPLIAPRGVLLYFFEDFRKFIGRWGFYFSALALRINSLPESTGASFLKHYTKSFSLSSGVFVSSHVLNDWASRLEFVSIRCQFISNAPWCLRVSVFGNLSSSPFIIQSQYCLWGYWVDIFGKISISACRSFWMREWKYSARVPKNKGKCKRVSLWDSVQKMKGGPN